MPELPDTHALAVIALTVFAFYLFSRESVPLETTGLIVLARAHRRLPAVSLRALMACQPVTDFYLGFGHEALVTICALMIMGRGLAATGALEPVARWFARAVGQLRRNWPCCCCWSSAPPPAAS